MTIKTMLGIGILSLNLIGLLVVAGLILKRLINSASNKNGSNAAIRKSKTKKGTIIPLKSSDDMLEDMDLSEFDDMNLDDFD